MRILQIDSSGPCILDLSAHGKWSMSKVYTLLDAAFIYPERVQITGIKYWDGEKDRIMRLVL